MIEQTPPFVDIELETKILRFLLIDDRVDGKNVIDEIAKNIGHIVLLGIPKDAFFSTFKQWLYETTLDTYLKHSQGITRSIVLERMEKKYPEEDNYAKKKVILDKIFKPGFKQSNFKLLIDDFRDKFNYRCLYSLNKNLHEKLKSDFEKHETGSIEIARKIDDTINKILISSDRFRVIEEDAFRDIEKDIALLKDKKANPEKYRGILSGFPKIDNITGGWGNGELIIVLGRPGAGKSVLLLNFGYNAFRNRYNIIYVTIEMPFEQQKGRLYSLITGTDYRSIKTAENLSDETIDMIEKRLKEEKEKHSNYFWFIDAPQNCDVSFLESRILSFESVSRQKADLVIVDPIYLMKPSMKTEDHVGVVSWDLKLLARKMNFPILCASQFNREAHKRHQHGKQADTADAAFSDKLGNNCDIMMGITGDKDETRLQFAKARDSLAETVFLEKQLNCMRFIEKQVKKID